MMYYVNSSEMERNQKLLWLFLNDEKEFKKMCEKYPSFKNLSNIALAQKLNALYSKASYSFSTVQRDAIKIKIDCYVLLNEIEFVKNRITLIEEKVNQLRDKEVAINKMLEKVKCDYAEKTDDFALKNKQIGMLDEWCTELQRLSKNSIAGEKYELLYQRRGFLEELRLLNQKLEIQKNKTELSRLQENYKLTREGNLNVNKKTVYQDVIEFYLYGLKRKSDAEHYYNSLNLNSNNTLKYDFIVGLLSDEQFIVSVFGKLVWKAIQQHEKEIMNTPLINNKLPLLSDPLLRQYVSRDTKYMNPRQIKRLRALYEYEKECKANPKLEPSIKIKNTMMRYNLLKTEEELDKQRIICAMADYKIMNFASNKIISEKFHYPESTVSYFFRTRLPEINYPKYMIVKSIGEEQNRSLGMSEDMIETLNSIKELINRGYSKEMALYLFNATDDLLEKGYQRSYEKRKKNQ